MSDTFTHYAELPSVIDDGSRQVHVSLGSLSGLELAYLGVRADGQNVDTVLTLPELRELVGALQSIDPEYQPSRGGYYLYRVVITKFPEGALFFYTDDGEEFGDIDPEWEPENWNPDEEYISRFGSRKFFWPSTKYEYRSQSSARSRARLIESFGATTEIVRSSLITWPEPRGSR